MSTQVPSSLPQLIARLSNGRITPSEIEQLNALLSADPIALEAYLDHMELDAMLEREFGGRVSAHQPIATAKARPMAWRYLAGVIAASVVLVVGFFVVDALRGPDSTAPVSENAPLVEIATDCLRVTKTEGHVQIKKSDGSMPEAAVGSRLLAGEMLEVGDGAAVLAYEDGTTFMLSGPTRLKVGGAAGKCLELSHGMMRARVAKQSTGRSVVIGTPNTVVRAFETRFELLADEHSGTQLDLESGRAELVRGREAAVAVEPNSIVIVPATDGPMKILPRPKMNLAEKRETRCLGQGLWSLDFAKDGRAVVASSNLGAFYWHDDDVTETIRALPDLKREGVKYLGASGPLAAFEQKTPHQIVLWNTATRTPARFVADLEKLPSAMF